MSRGGSVLVCVAALVGVSCGSGSSDSPALATEPTGGTEPATAPDETTPGTAAVPTTQVIVDEAFLRQQAERSLAPDEPGAVLVAVYDADGDHVAAAIGTDPNGSPPSLDDTYRLGSITKVITAITVLTLVDDGLIELDSPVAEHVTRFEIDPSVTVRQLLQHTAGISDPTGFLTAIADDRSRVWTPDEVVATTSLDELEPGGPHAYANVNYTILGVLIEEVTGQPYHEVVRARVLEPLGMGDTYLSSFEDGAEPFVGYYDQFGEGGFSGTPAPVDFDLTSTDTHAWASGAMVSTAADLHRLMSSLFAGEVVSQTLVEEMTPTDGYGLGLYIPEFSAETPLYGHDGRTVGSGTWLIHAPDTGATVFTVANGDHLRVSPATEAVAEAIGAEGFDLEGF